MKQSLKRILPILLGIVIICSIAWYLFVYDQDLTRDLLLSQARYFDSKGNHAVSAWLYKAAYQQSGNGEDVAIELARRFIEDGNYSKAEYTLSNAISDNGGSVKLYTALSKTYVEQNKLLDAVEMLSRVQEPVKSQLDALRPAIPTVSPAPGFYSQYITVDITHEDGTLYITTDRRYPSTEDAPSDGSVTLVAGENTIYAIAVGDNGLVSPLAVFGYTVAGVIEEVSFADSRMEQALREKLQLPDDETVFTDDLWTITEFTVPEGVSSLQDLAYLPYLQSLTVENAMTEDFSILSSLHALTELSIRNCMITSATVQAIASLPELEKLTLSGCGLSNIDKLATAQRLKTLDLSGNAIRDLSSIAFMSELEQLDLSGNALTSLNYLSSLSSLKVLDVSENALTSIAPLAGCTNLISLDISTNAITSTMGAETLENLMILIATRNQLTDISALANCKALVDVELSHNLLTDISALGDLVNLESCTFAWNQVAVLPAWNADSALVYIDGSNNQILALDTLRGLPLLNNIMMSNNQITAIRFLVECPMLIVVDISGNPVKEKEVDALKISVNGNSTGISVIHDPFT